MITYPCLFKSLDNLSLRFDHERNKSYLLLFVTHVLFVPTDHSDWMPCNDKDPDKVTFMIIFSLNSLTEILFQ